MSGLILKCLVCGTEFNANENNDICPYCDWFNHFFELEEDDPASMNPLTLRQAKKNLENGLNVWGEPLPKR